MPNLENVTQFSILSFAARHDPPVTKLHIELHPSGPLKNSEKKSKFQCLSCIRDDYADFKKCCIKNRNKL